LFVPAGGAAVSAARVAGSRARRGRGSRRDEGREPVRLVIGRIGKPHGLRGEVTVELRTDDPEGRFAPGAVLATDPPERGPLTVISGRFHSGRMLLWFREARDRTAAEALRNTLLVIEVDPDEPTGDPEEYYDHQLVDLAVVTVDGREVGTVAEMLHIAGQDLFAVRRPEGGEVLIPFVSQIVPEVDLTRRTIVVDPPEGLLELGEPETASGDTGDDDGDAFDGDRDDGDADDDHDDDENTDG
jgi:16S rRNA processing protein RimM